MPEKTAARSEKKIPKKILSKDINFFNNKEPKVFNKKTANRNAIAFFVFFLCLFGLLYPTMSMMNKNRELEAGIEHLQAAIAKAAATEESEAFWQKVTRLEQMQLYTTAVETAGAKFTALPKADPVVLNKIYARLAEGVSVLSLNYTDGVYTVDCLAEDVLSPPQTVANLVNIGAFRSVNYTGFSESNAFAGYEFTVACTAKGESE